MGVRDLIPQRVREARTAAGLTQEQLAEAVDLQPLTISFIENGRRLPKLETLEAIAAATNRQLSWFFPLIDDADEDDAVPVGWIIGHLESTQKSLERMEQEIRVHLIANRAAISRIYSETLRSPEQRRRSRAESRWAMRRFKRREAIRNGGAPLPEDWGTEPGEQDWNRSAATEELRQEVEGWCRAMRSVIEESEADPSLNHQFLRHNEETFLAAIDEYRQRKLDMIQMAYPERVFKPDPAMEARVFGINWSDIFSQLLESLTSGALESDENAPATLQEATGAVEEASAEILTNADSEEGPDPPSPRRRRR